MATLTASGLGKQAEARKYGDAFLAKFPDHKLAADVLFIGAESRLLTGDYAGAAERYRDLLKRSPKHASAPQARVRLGLALQLQKKYPEVIALLEPAVEDLSDKALRAEALYLIGRSYA